MNKIGPNPTHTATENRNSSASVVTSFRGDRRSVETNGSEKSADTVALSNQAVDLNALEQRIKQLPEVDTARVVELHNRIMSGDYEVDSERLAGKILDLESNFDF